MIEKKAANRTLSLRQLQAIGEEEWPKHILKLDPTASEIANSAMRLVNEAHAAKKIRKGRITKLRKKAETLATKGIVIDAHNEGANDAFDLISALLGLSKRLNLSPRIEDLRNLIPKFRLQKIVLAREVLDLSDELQISSKRKVRGRPKHRFNNLEVDLGIHVEMMKWVLNQNQKDLPSTASWNSELRKLVTARYNAGELKKLGDTPAENIDRHMSRLKKNLPGIIAWAEEQEKIRSGSN